MTMGLPCDSDGYDLRIRPCKMCGSRGCTIGGCHETCRFPHGWLAETIEKAARRPAQPEERKPE